MLAERAKKPAKFASSALINLQGLVYSARDRTEVKALYHLGTVLVRSN